MLKNLSVLCPSCHSKEHKELHENRRDKKTGQYLKLKKIKYKKIIKDFTTQREPKY